MADILEYDSVTIDYLDKKAVDNVSFSLNPGKIIGIVGESGSGKTTIIKSINRILSDEAKITNGQIRFNGKNLNNLSEREMSKLRGSEIGMIFQDSASSLCPIRTIGSQLTEVIRAHEKISKKDAKERGLSLFERLNFNDPEKLWNSYPFELSGGMNQRVGIALGIILNPRLLLADEPTSALDVKSAELVINELLLIREKLGTGIVIVSHDMELMENIADDILVLKDGKVQEYGTKEDVIFSPKADYTKELLSSVVSPEGSKWNL